MSLFTSKQHTIIEFCARECHLQQSGELSVEWMLAGWEHAVSHADDALDEAHIAHLGRLVEPRKNLNGFRRVGVRVGDDVKMNWIHVPGAVVDLLKVQADVTPEWFFHEYENIHPFRDGNGRTGAILYNWLRGSLMDPVWPPNDWDDPRRVDLRFAE